MYMALTAGLFLSLFAVLLLLLVPAGVYGTSPAAITADMVRRRLEEKLLEGEKSARLAVIKRSPGDIIKTGLLIGLGLGFLTLLLGYHFIGMLAIPLAVGVTIIGIYMAEYGAHNEFKSWQSRFFEGMPVLVDFVPAFLEVGSINTREALNLTVPFLPEPLKTEVTTALNKIRRTNKVKEAMDTIASRAKHPVADSVCFRLSANWNNMQPEMFDDLGDEMEDIQEMAATRATTLKGGMFAMIGVVGLLGALLIYGYPGWLYTKELIGGGFGI